MNNNDFDKGLDLSGRAGVSGTELNQLVENAGPSDDRGLNLFTSDVAGVAEIPDASTNGDHPEWQRYMWIRKTATGVLSYFWNAAGSNDQYGAGFKYWYPANQSSGGGVAANTITGLIVGSQIESVDWTTQVSGKPTVLTQDTNIDPGGFGDVSGTINTGIVHKNGSVDPEHINDLTGAKLVQKKFWSRVDTDEFDGGSSGGAGVWSLSARPTKASKGLALFTQNYTPKATTNYLHIKFSGSFSSDVSGANIMLALFQNESDAINACMAAAPGEGKMTHITCEWFGLVSSLPTGTLAEMAISAKIGTNSTVVNVRYNGYYGAGGYNVGVAALLFNGYCATYLSIEEYRP